MYLGGNLMIPLYLVARAKTNLKAAVRWLVGTGDGYPLKNNHKFATFLSHGDRHVGVFCVMKQDGRLSPRRFVDSSRRQICQNTSRAFCCWFRQFWLRLVHQVAQHAPTPLQQLKSSSLCNLSPFQWSQFTQVSISNLTLGQAETPVPFAPNRIGAI